MAAGTTDRLDTVDVALDLGWQVDSVAGTDTFTRDDVRVVAEYGPTDELTSVARTGGNQGCEMVEANVRNKPAVLRAWLTGGAPSVQQTRKRASAKVSKAPKLRWSKEKWLHKPTQEIVDNDDPRIPKKLDDEKKLSKIWYRMGSQANVDDGYYRRDLEPDTIAAPEPVYTATWNPLGSAPEQLVRGTGGDAYWACVRHHQAKYAD